MDEDFESVEDGAKEVVLSETKRVSRNMNEKKRRDRFNILIGELAAVVPDSSSGGGSKFDKTTVLKKAVAYLRSKHSSSTVAISRPTTHWQPAFVNDTELNQVLLEAMAGFVFVLDGSGIITFASDSIISILGFRPQDVVNNSIADYLDQSDKSCIFAHLALLEKLRNPTQLACNAPYSSVAISEPVSFEMTMTTGPCLESQLVEPLSCTGQAFTTTAVSNSATKFQMTVICYPNTSKANLTQPLFDVTAKEFSAKMTLDWKFTQVDNRVTNVMGYKPAELIDKSIYRYIHNDDLNNVKLYHEMLVRKGRINTCYYRFLTKGETWIWLRSCCYISYNQWNSKPEYVTMTTSPVHYEEVYANQKVLVKNDRLHFQSISRDFRSESCIKICSQRADSPLRFTDTQADQAENTAGILKMISHSKTGKKDQNKKIEIPSIKENGSLSLSSIPNPDALSPAQYNLHMQLLGKHQLLEKSIENQITELQKIKRQIEINKQLWEFNRQLQEKKAIKLGRSSTPSYGSYSSGCGSDQMSEASNKNAPMKENMDTSTNEDSQSPVAMELPPSVYLTLQDLGEDIMQQQSSSMTPILNNSSQLFAPLQPYNYFQY